MSIPLGITVLVSFLLSACQSNLDKSKLICVEFEQGKLSVQKASEGLGIGDIGPNTDMAITAACSRINP